MPFHNYFCYVISNKLPRLLAEREIIAIALFFTNDVMSGILYVGITPNAETPSLCKVTNY